MGATASPRLSSAKTPISARPRTCRQSATAGGGVGHLVDDRSEHGDILPRQHRRADAPRPPARRRRRCAVRRRGRGPRLRSPRGRRGRDRHRRRPPGRDRAPARDPAGRTGRRGRRTTGRWRHGRRTSRVRRTIRCAVRPTWCDRIVVGIVAVEMSEGEDPPFDVESLVLGSSQQPPGGEPGPGATRVEVQGDDHRRHLPGAVGKPPHRVGKAVGPGYTASGPISPVRMRVTASIGDPRPCRRRSCRCGRLRRWRRRSGRRRRRRRRPRCGPWARSRRCTRRLGRPRCGRAWRPKPWTSVTGHALDTERLERRP